LPTWPIQRVPRHSRCHASSLSLHRNTAVIDAIDDHPPSFDRKSLLIRIHTPGGATNGSQPNAALQHARQRVDAVSRVTKKSQKNSIRQLFAAKTTIIVFNSAGRANGITGQNVFAPVCVWLTRMAQITAATRRDL